MTSSAACGREVPAGSEGSEPRFGIGWGTPNDYDVLDEGRLFVHPTFTAAFPWRTLDEVMNADVDVIRKVDERDNCRTVVAGRTCYLKRHRQRRLRLRGVPAGRWEATAVQWCRNANVPTMRLIAAGWEGSRSFFLSEAIPEGVPADDFWRANHDRNVRKRVISALAETARRFHSAELFHRDFYWCHFFIRPASDGVLTAHLIDLQRLLSCHGREWWSSPFRWRWQVKDLGQFWFSAPADVTAEDRKAWFDIYFDRGRRKATQWAAMVRAGFYRFKERTA